MKKAFWMGLTLLPLALTVAVASADPGRPGQRRGHDDHDRDRFHPRDFYRLSLIERDFLRFDADANSAPYGSYQREAAVRARNSAAQEAQREADAVFIRLANGETRESLPELERLLRELETNSQWRTPKYDFYKSLLDVAGRGIEADLELLASRRSILDVEPELVNLHQMVETAQYRSLRYDIALKAFRAGARSSLLNLDSELQRSDYRRKYDIERRLSDGRRLARYGSELDRYYSEAIQIVRHSSDPQQPDPYAVRVQLVLDNNRAINVSNGQLVTLARGSRVTLRGVLTRFGQEEYVQLQARALNSAQAVRVDNGPAGMVLTAVQSSINEAPLQVVASTIGQIDFQQPGRGHGGPQAQQSVSFSVRVVLGEFGRFSPQTATVAVRAAFKGILGRDADFPGAQGYVDLLLREGWNGWKRALKDIAQSPEARSKHASMSPEQVVTMLFNGLLSRNPGPEGLNAYVPHIRSGRVADAAEGIGSSEEFRERIIGQ